MNSKLFDELTASYKAERQKEKKREKERDELWKRLSQLEFSHKSKSQHENNLNEMAAQESQTNKD